MHFTPIRATHLAALAMFFCTACADDTPSAARSDAGADDAVGAPADTAGLCVVGQSCTWTQGGDNPCCEQFTCITPRGSASGQCACQSETSMLSRSDNPAACATTYSLYATQGLVTCCAGLECVGRRCARAGGQPCTSDIQCAHRSCVNGICGACRPENAGCNPELGQNRCCKGTTCREIGPSPGSGFRCLPTCAAANETCAQNTDCCSQVCQNGRCGCVPTGERCPRPGDGPGPAAGCCAGFCGPSLTCGTRCRPDGQACDNAQQCCGGTRGAFCVEGRCASACTSNCTSRGGMDRCGNDRCGGVCPDQCASFYGPGYRCADPVRHLCVGPPCIRNCAGRTCGPDGCDGSCGTCPA